MPAAGAASPRRTGAEATGAEGVRGAEGMERMAGVPSSIPLGTRAAGAAREAEARGEVGAVEAAVSIHSRSLCLPLAAAASEPLRTLELVGLGKVR